MYIESNLDIYISIYIYIGDIGKFDQDSGLTITDRMKELIKYKGFQVAPAELESLINSHPAVYECIVIPVLREDAGEIPRAYVVLKPSAPQVDEAEIVKFVTEKVSPHKKLRGGVVFVKKIPKSASGKLLRRVQIEIDRGYRPPLDE